MRQIQSMPNDPLGDQQYVQLEVGSDDQQIIVYTD